MAAVREILQWAQAKNVDSHFPLVATGYGYLALLMAGMKNEGSIQQVNDDMAYISLELNLRLKPQDTYVFDSYGSLDQMESVLNNVTFYHELIFGVPLNKFLGETTLSQVFVPVATFNQDKRDQSEELVAIVEGAHFPFFGLAFSVDRFQFNDDLAIEEDISHNKEAVKLAQRLANLFVDEARLCPQSFRSARDEYQVLIDNYDHDLLEGTLV